MIIDTTNKPTREKILQNIQNRNELNAKRSHKSNKNKKKKINCNRL